MYGPECSKAGVSPLQGDRGGFDSEQRLKYTEIALFLNTQLGQRSSIGLMGVATDGWCGYMRYVSNNE